MFEHFRGDWFQLFLVKICILICFFIVILENYSMRTLSIRLNDFIAHWAYEETISSHTEQWAYAKQIFAYAQPA